MTENVLIHPTDHLETLRRCGGYYECPKNNEGRRLGPLVGYAGKYEAPDGTQKQWVGDVYVNFAMVEEESSVLFYFAGQMEEKIKRILGMITVFCGAPLGGYDFATALGYTFDRRVIKAEKKITALATATSREESDIVFGRHSPKKGDVVAVVEDVCNNFSTTAKLIELIYRYDARPWAIICFLNRSLTVGGTYYPPYSPTNTRTAFPVISLVEKPIQEYKQDDPKAKDDIVNGNVVWKPKDDWPRLMAAMEGR